MEPRSDKIKCIHQIMEWIRIGNPEQAMLEMLVLVPIINDWQLTKSYYVLSGGWHTIANEDLRQSIRTEELITRRAQTLEGLMNLVEQICKRERITLQEIL